MRENPLDPTQLNHQEQNTLKMYVNLLRQYPVLTQSSQHVRQRERLEPQINEAYQRMVYLEREIETICSHHAMERPKHLNRAIPELAKQYPTIFSKK